MQCLARRLTLAAISIFFYLSALCPINAKAQQKETGGRFLIFVNGKVGYIDRAGRIVIKPQYEDSWGFHEGFARVRTSGKWGFIDETGKMVIPGVEGVRRYL